jgi:hypothetical protein
MGIIISAFIGWISCKGGFISANSIKVMPSDQISAWPLSALISREDYPLIVWNISSLVADNLRSHPFENIIEVLLCLLQTNRVFQLAYFVCLLDVLALLKLQNPLCDMLKRIFVRLYQV